MYPPSFPLHVIDGFLFILALLLVSGTVYFIIRRWNILDITGLTGTIISPPSQEQLDIYREEAHSFISIPSYYLECEPLIQHERPLFYIPFKLGRRIFIDKSSRLVQGIFVSDKRIIFHLPFHNLMKRHGSLLYQKSLISIEDIATIEFRLKRAWPSPHPAIYLQTVGTTAYYIVYRGPFIPRQLAVLMFIFQSVKRQDRKR